RYGASRNRVCRYRTGRKGRFPSRPVGRPKQGTSRFGHDRCARRRHQGLLGQGGLVGSQYLHAAVDPLVGNDERFGPQGQPHLPHGLAIGGPKKATDVQAGLPPMTAVTRIIRSSGISALESTAICGKWCRRKRASDARSTGGTTITGASPRSSWLCTTRCVSLSRLSA